MITLYEQYGYNSPRIIKHDISNYHFVLNSKDYTRYFKGKKGDNVCFKILHKTIENCSTYLFESSYFIGTDWIVENKLPIHITSKLNKENKEINYMKMLSDALKQTSSIDHLEGLFEIDFNKSMIEIPQSKDLLTPLLVIQFLHLLKKIVKKGLKKSYYKVEQNLNARVRGKILINRTVRKNHTKGKKDDTYCAFDIYGIDSIENRILKKTLLFIRKALDNIRGLDQKEIISMYNYILPAFTNVTSHVEDKELKHFKANPIFKEYKEALKLSKLILKKYGYNISNVNSIQAKTPPFWIDMSKLFELYVFSKLKEVFPNRGEVKYQQKIFFRELDYLLKSDDRKYKMVIDAKYKPQYANKHPSIKDLRQISGYARMTKVYSELEIENDKNIDCLIIFPNQSLVKNDFHDVEFNHEDLKVNQYVNIYKIGIALPEI